MNRIAYGARRPVVTTLAATLAAAGIAVAGVASAGAPATAAGTQTATQAAAGHAALAAAVAPSATKTTAAKTVSVPFTWSNGQAVKATVVTRANATVKKASSLSGYAAVGDIWANVAVLPDGRQVGVVKGVVKVREKNGKLRNYFSGKAPKVDAILVQGSTVLGVKWGSSSTKVTLFKGGNSKVSKTTTLRTDAVYSVALSGGRLYYTKPVGKQGAYSSQLRSVAVGGTTSKLVANNAGSPQVAPNGELFYVTVTKASWPVGGRPAAVKSLKTGKTTLKSTGIKVLGQSAWDDTPASLVVSGDTVSMENVGGRGTLIMNTKTRKAWFVQAASGKYAGTPSVSGSRVLTTSINPYNPPYTGAKEFGVFDASKGKLTVYTTNNGVEFGAINNKAVAFVTEPKQGTYSTGSGRIG